MFADSKHGHIPDSFHDPKIALRHELSFPQADRDCHPCWNFRLHTTAFLYVWTYNLFVMLVRRMKRA